MSFIDRAKGMVSGASGQEAATLISGLIQQHGGVQGLLDHLHASGLGNLAKSWVGTGPNLPVSATQIQGSLGRETLEKLAASTGISPAAAAEQIAKYLPTVVDKLSPSGSLPQGGAEAPNVTNLLSALFKERGSNAS
ncbi:MAG: YidB family protein [Bdellovibrionota bacterium]